VSWFISWIFHDQLEHMFDRMYVRNTASYLASGRGKMRKLSNFRPRRRTARSRRVEITMSSIAFGSNASVTRRPVAAPHVRVTAPRLRVTARGRAVVTVMIAIPLAIAAATLGLGAAGAAAGTHSGSASAFHYVTVDPGESLWQLAQTVAPTADPRDVIADIMTLNNLSSAEVQPGQRLAIPTQYDN
jgi:hypothetical protein